MAEIMSNDLVCIAVLLLLIVAFGALLSWGSNHIGSDIVEIVKDAVEEKRKGQIKVVR